VIKKDGDFEYRITFYAARDGRDPDPSKNYGIIPTRIRFVLLGPKGAEHFLMGTGWPPRAVGLHGRCGDAHCANAPMGYDVGYHSFYQHYEGQQMVECDLLPGGRCYCDGSALQAQEVMWGLIERGEEAVWEALKERYDELKGEDK